ncbi:hypothetical protein DFQ29_000278 [Apophysomyces sp. BC1021]|nr:hypothetical protein DFQ29_000278 [Apophysomyces sp. BC1021]
MQNPPGGGGSQTKRHSMRSPPVRQASFGGQPSSISLDRTLSSHSTGTSQGTYTSPQRPTSPVTSPSLHKSLNALDAKSITSNMERSTLHDVMMTSPSSPGATANPTGFYFANPSNTVSTTSFQPMPAPPSAPYPYHRQGSVSSLTLSSMTSTAQNTQGDVWQKLCVCVLPLFNGEGVQGAIEDLNELVRRCLTDPISPQLYNDIESLLRDGMFTLNAKMLGVSDEKLLDRLVEQWSFFFTYALPYFEAVFLPLRTDVRYRSVEEAEMWNMRNLVLRSFRDNVILLQTKRLEDVFTKLFTDFGSSQNPAATAAKMLQMTSILASSPDHNEEIERILSNLKLPTRVDVYPMACTGKSALTRANQIHSKHFTVAERQGLLAFFFGNDTMIGTKKTLPCKECRKQRRKCVRSPENKVCDRCARLDRLCVPVDEKQPKTEFAEDDDDDIFVDGTKELEYLYDQMAQLQQCMKKMEVATGRGSNDMSYLAPLTPVSICYDIEDEMDGLDDGKQEIETTTAITTRATRAAVTATTAPLPGLPSEWKLTFINGQLRIETGIQSISELLKYSQAAPRSLSPFPGLSSSTPLLFRNTLPAGMISTSIKVLSGYIARKSTVTALIPATLLFEPRLVIDQLLQAYFNCFNLYMPLIHRPTFMEHYRKTRDPFSCPITMAICANICMCSCRHLQFSLQERRHMAEYFYQLCRDMLYDMFDDPDRRLETLITANLITKFLINTLRMSEARKTTSMALLICADLQHVYDKHSLEGILCTRHYVMAECTQKAFDVFLERKVDENCFLRNVFLGYLPDEPEITQRYMRMGTFVMEFCTRPHITELTKQIRRIELHDVAEIELEIIIGFEEQTTQWWRSLPSEFRLCDNPFSSDSKAQIESCNDVVKLSLFVYVQMIQIGIHSYLIQPNMPATTDHLSAILDMLAIIQDRALNLTLLNGELLLLAAKKMERMESFCHLSNEYLFKVIDALCSMVSSQNPRIATEAKQRLHECSVELNNFFFLEGHRIPPSSSPIASAFSLDNSKHILDMYDLYPLPRLALMYDLVLNSVSQSGLGEILSETCMS